MKYDPKSKVRSQRELMQPFQIRLMKDQIRDLQLLRLFAGIKVSEELRQLVTKYIDDRRDMLQKIIAQANSEVTLTNPEQVEAAHELSKYGQVKVVSKPKKTKS